MVAPYRTAISPVIAAMALASCRVAVAEVSLPKVFSDGMVLQQQVPVPVWGKATRGERVVVKIAGQSLETTADDRGRWRVMLAPLDAASHRKPLTMTVAGTNTLTIDRIRIGEVWLLAGGERVAKQVRMLSHAKSILAEAADAPVVIFTAGSAGGWQPLQAGNLATTPAEAYLFAATSSRKWPDRSG